MERELWDKIDGETSMQYKAFCVYRDMGTDDITGKQRRSLRKVAKETGRNRQTLEGWSVKNNWLERAEAYDIHLAKKRQQAHEKEIEKMHGDHAKIAQQFITKATKRLLTLPDEEISPGDAVRMFDIGVRIERLSRGESTENKQLSGKATITHDGSVEIKKDQAADMSKLTDEELSELEELLEKLHK